MFLETGSTLGFHDSKLPLGRSAPMLSVLVFALLFALSPVFAQPSLFADSWR